MFYLYENPPQGDPIFKQKFEHLEDAMTFALNLSKVNIAPDVVESVYLDWHSVPGIFVSRPSFVGTIPFSYPRFIITDMHGSMSYAEV